MSPASHPFERPGLPSPIPLSQLTDPRLRAERRMFIPPPGMNAGAAERAQQQSRGYVLGIILLVLFLSSQDFSPPARRHRVEAAKGIHEGVSKHREDVKEKVSAEAGPNPNDKNGKSCAPHHAPRLTTRTSIADNRRSERVERTAGDGES